MSSLPVPAGAALPAPVDAGALARRIGCSQEAVELTRATELIDLHLDTMIPPRLWGYDPLARHDSAWFGRWWFGHTDLPRMIDGGLSGGMWSLTTNPARGAGKRWQVFQANLQRLRDVLERSGGALQFARDVAEYRRVRATGAHAVLLSVQGGNALQAAPEGPASVPDRLLVRATLVHLTTSSFGETSCPLRLLHPTRGLTAKGAAFIEQCNAHEVFVDLAHIGEKAFWQAVDVHDKTQPLIATHTGVDGVRRSWRNLSDAQIKAIADTGGTVGVIFSEVFLRRRGGPRDGTMVLEHMEHVISVAGEDHVSVGSDYDGMIQPPMDICGADTYPRLVQHMLDRGWSVERIQKVLGGNFLRSWQLLRPGDA